MQYCKLAVASCHCLLHVSVILLQKVCLLVKHVDSLYSQLFSHAFENTFSEISSEVVSQVYSQVWKVKLNFFTFWLHVSNFICFSQVLKFTGFFPGSIFCEPLQNSQFFFSQGISFVGFSQVFHGFSSNSDSQQGWIMSVHKQDLMACAGMKAWAP